MNQVLKHIYTQPGQLFKLITRLRDDKDLRGLQTDLIQKKHTSIILTGMGASYFAAYAGCLYLQGQGIPAYCLETSELLFYGLGAIPAGTTLIIVSQSGESIEVQEILARRSKDQEVWGITNALGSPLGRSSDRRLSLGVPLDHSIAVKTYTCALGLLLALFSAYSPNKEYLGELIQKAALTIENGLKTWPVPIESAAKFLGNSSSITLLGYGPSLASAWEGALLFKEGAKI